MYLVVCVLTHITLHVGNWKFCCMMSFHDVASIFFIMANANFPFLLTLRKAKTPQKHYEE